VINIPEEGSNRGEEVTRAAVDAVLFFEAIARDESLPCESAEEYVVTATVVVAGSVLFY